jgi:DNA-binding NarL/FixJ family response regulator
MRKPRLLLADDHEDVLREIGQLLQADFDVIGVARDGLTLVEIAANLHPDVVVTDFRMPGLNGIDASARLLQNGWCKAAVLLTLYVDRQLVRTALRAGIGAFVLKVRAGEDLIPAIHSVLRGGTYISALGTGPV